MSGRRLYLGRLPPDTRSEDLNKHFDGYGKITECRVMTGFGFVEFENTKDAEDVVNNFNGKPFNGASNIIVEFAKENRRREDRDYGRAPPPRAVQRRPPGIRVNISGISRDTSWQDLKDFGREAGMVSFSDVDRDDPGHGILEYVNYEDAEYAIRSLDGKELRGVPVHLSIDSRDRRSPRRERSRSPYRGGGGGGSGGAPSSRREERPPRRSRSPPRRYDDRERGDYRRDDRRERYDDRDRRDDGADAGWDRRR